MTEDHLRAKKLAEAINEIDGFSVDLDSVETNMVYIQGAQGAKEILRKLSELGIDVLEVGPIAVRAVTHLHITDEDISRTIEAFKQIA
jgi:threonine aldolase